MAIQALNKIKNYIGLGIDTSYDEEYVAGDYNYSRAGQQVVNPEVGTKHTMTTLHPHSFNDAVAIGEAFRNGMTTVVNVSGVAEPDARRIIDFASGLIFGLNGAIERVERQVFILTPVDVAVVSENTSVRSDFYNHG